MTDVKKIIGGGSFLANPAELVAPRLLGCELVYSAQGVNVRLKIVETEAYSQQDAASHSYKGQTPRTTVMFGPAGRLYVYFTYGMHYCCNIVTGQVGDGEAVLLRAVEPLNTTEQLTLNRRGQTGVNLTNGPAKLCQALRIDRSYNGHDLADQPLQLKIKPALGSDKIVVTRRIGISRAQDKLWRFYIRDNPYISRPKA